MIKKGVIIGTFVLRTKILSFLEELKNRFQIKMDKVFVYEIDSNEKEYLVTFKTFDKNKFIKKIQNSTIMHVKNNCIFSINALNQLIDEKYASSDEIPYNEIEINWDEYKDCLIILTNGKLNIVKLSKIDDKCTFLA